MHVQRCPTCARIYDASERFCSADGAELGAHTPDDPLVGKKAGGRYLIERRLAGGGMGHVYLARELRSERPVAVKVLRHELASDARSDARFLREARAISRLRSPHAVGLLDVGLIDERGPRYIAMELLAGETLRDRLDRERTLPPVLTVDVVRQAAAGVADAHALGLVHRDLKPSNLFLVATPGYEAFVKVLDFGIAVDRARETRLTRSGEVPGTPAYIAPECLDGGHADARADVYALGAIAFECLTGAPPPPTTPAQRGIRAAHAAPRPAEALAEVPAGLRALVLRCLAQDPRLRPEHAGALLVALSGRRDEGLPTPAPAVETREAVQTWPTPVPDRRRRPRPNVVRAVAGAALVGVAAFMLGRATTDEEPARAADVDAAAESSARDLVRAGAVVTPAPSLTAVRTRPTGAERTPEPQPTREPSNDAADLLDIDPSLVSEAPGPPEPTPAATPEPAAASPPAPAQPLTRDAPPPEPASPARGATSPTRVAAPATRPAPSDAAERSAARARGRAVTPEPEASETERLIDVLLD